MYKFIEFSFNRVILQLKSNVLPGLPDGDTTILTIVISIAAMHAQLLYVCLITHNFGRGSFGYVGLQSGSLNKKG